MLRPVRSLRRSVDTSRRSSSDVAGKGDIDSLRCANQLPRPASNSCASAGVEEIVNEASPTHSTSVAAAPLATSLPPLKPGGRRPTQHPFKPHLPPGMGFCSAAVPDLANVPARVAVSGTRSKGNMAGAASVGGAMSPSAFATHNTCLIGDDETSQRASLLPTAAQRLFTSGEIDRLRADARVEYTVGRRLQERKDLVHEETQQRHLLAADAVGQIQAVRQWETEAREALMRAKSAEALPLQYLEQRIQARIASDYSKRDAELRQEGRAAWMEHVAKSKEASAEPQPSDVERRAASHRFRAALTFIVVEERNLRDALASEAARAWESFRRAEEVSKAETAQRALERFLNTPEQLAIAAARERQERKQAKLADKQRKLFQQQQDGFVKGCRHGAGGTSVFEGDAPKKICGRCRVKWDEELGFYVSIDRSVKVHHPPAIAKADGAAQEKKPHADAPGGRGAVPNGGPLPVLKGKAK